MLLSLVTLQVSGARAAAESGRTWPVPKSRCKEDGRALHFC